MFKVGDIVYFTDTFWNDAGYIKALRKYGVQGPHIITSTSSNNEFYRLRGEDSGWDAKCFEKLSKVQYLSRRVANLI